MKTLLKLLCLFLLMAFTAAAEAPQLANSSARHGISLNGTWHYLVDVYDTGRNSHMERDFTPRDKTQWSEYGFAGSPLLNVPGDWNTQSQQLFFYEGTIWYQRTFSVEKHAGTRLFLHFGAVANRATVYLNGAKLGSHEGAFTPFDFEVTDKAREGVNDLVVEVNNRRSADAVPALNTDWWNYGGITREVSLVEVPASFIEDYSVQLAKGSEGTVEGWVRLNGATAPESVTVAIPEAGIRQSLTTDAAGLAHFRFPAKLQLWSPETPKLYTVKIASANDAIADEIGFRTIEVRGSKIYLNGKQVFLRGISIHEEAPFRSGRAISTEDDATLLGWAKELGCNFVRLAHYPHNEQMTRLADRLGLMVWSEVPVYWDTAWTNPATLANAGAQLRSNIARDHNRASIVIWSVANETTPSPERTAFLGHLIDEVRLLDGTRLIGAALNHWENPAPNTRLLSDPLGEKLDVLGLNEYLGWYEGHFADFDRVKWQFALNKPVIVSEFGGGAVAGLHGDSETRWSEEYQRALFEKQLKMLSQMPQLAGMSPWLLMDFLSPRRLMPGIQDYYNRKGLISNRGQRKEAFSTLQEFYQQKAKEQSSLQQ
jgi:beta-glucuronidase